VSEGIEKASKNPIKLNLVINQFYGVEEAYGKDTTNDEGNQKVGSA
jgi:hypothetical protein